MLVAAVACVQGGGPALPEPAAAPGVPGAEGAANEPLMKVALVAGAPAVALGGGGALRVAGPDGTLLGGVEAQDVRRIVPADGGVAVETPRGRRTPGYARLEVRAADSAGTVRVEGRDYRGSVTLALTPEGRVRAVNTLPIETYLASVVSSELGRRDPAEREAVMAQAVVSRTYALKAQGRAIAAGFDLTSGVMDQVYGGVANETDLGWQAVRATRGEVLTFGGALIDAQFFSTCAGRTADNDEAFRGGPRSYLRSVPDVDASGTPYCRISPRFRWRVEWSGAELRPVLVRGLAAQGVPPEALRRVRDVRRLGQSRSGRATGVVIVHDGGESVVEAGRLRDVFRSPAGDPLRSTAIEPSVTRRGGVVERLVIDGRGAGHGVGMCQWGAVGRARAGQRYGEILAAYFQGTALERRY